MQVLETMGIKDQVELQAVDLNEGVQAVKNRRAVGFSTASSAPAGMVSEISSTTQIRLLNLSDADYQKVSKQFARYVIPAGTYKGVDYDVKTMSLLVGTYTTTDLSDEVAYEITKAFWENRAIWEKSHPAMKLVKMEERIHQRVVGQELEQIGCQLGMGIDQGQALTLHDELVL